MTREAEGNEDEVEEPKIIPTLSKAEERIAYNRMLEDPAVQESRLFNRGESSDDLEKQAAKFEAKRAEKFKDNFELVSIFGLYFISIIFMSFTFVWAINLILPKYWQFLDDNQEDKLQLIITGGFVAGLASSHLKKRLGG